MPQRRTLLVAVAALALARPSGGAETAPPSSSSASTSTTFLTPNTTISTSIASPPSLVPFSWILHSTDAILQYEGESWETATVSGSDALAASTSSSGASLSFSFVGTEVAILGTRDASTGLLWTVDGSVTQLGPSTHPSDTAHASANPVLIDARVPYGYHNATLLLLGGGRVNVMGVNITTGLYTQASSFTNATTSIQSFASNNGFYHLSGPWASSSDGHMTASSEASFWAAVPANTSYLALSGATAAESSSAYTVSVSPAPPYNFPAATQLRAHPSASGSGDPSAAASLFMAPLDPTVEYNLTFALDPGAGNVTLHSTTFYSALIPQVDAPAHNGSATADTNVQSSGSANSQESGTGNPEPSDASAPANKPAIIGGSVGGGVGLIVLLGVLFLLYRRSAAKKATKQVEEDTESVSPYIPLPSGLHTRSQSVLGLGNYISTMASSQPAEASSLSSYSTKDASVSAPDAGVHPNIPIPKGPGPAVH